MVNLSCSYTKQEVLTLIAEHAGHTLKANNAGVIRAKFLDDGSVEVIFLPDNTVETKSEKLN